MFISTKAIVLSKLKYRDSDLIVRCYTKQQGIVSFILRGILKSRKRASKTAYFQLLSQLQLDYNFKSNSSLHSITEVKLDTFYSSLHTNVYKSSIVIFLSEILATTLQEEEANTLLYEYIENALQWLDNSEDYANFHLLFLINLTKYLGINPDTLNIDLKYFNLQEGKFEVKPSNKYSISGENLTLLKLLLGTNFAVLNEIKINSKQRQAMLTLILLYFELHLGSFKKPKSLQIFNQVFNS
ncbi:DNA repair protein RecO [Lacinutrix salivirga]